MPRRIACALVLAVSLQVPFLSAFPDETARFNSRDSRFTGLTHAAASRPRFTVHGQPPHAATASRRPHAGTIGVRASSAPCLVTTAAITNWAPEACRGNCVEQTSASLLRPPQMVIFRA